MVAIPQLTDLYRLYERRPVFDYRWTLDLAGSATPSAFEVLATVAAVNPRGLRGLIMVSAGFGKGFSEVMNASEDAFKVLGTKVRVPSLWLYARGNWRIPDDTAKEIFAAFHAGSRQISRAAGA